MLEIIRSRYPANQWHNVDMRRLNLSEEFDGIIAWHSFFHLPLDGQKIALRRFSEHLAPGGALMLTVGSDEGEAIGHVGGEEVYHASFSFKSYETLLKDLGITIVRFKPDDLDCDGASVLLAQKRIFMGA